jgi:hypothetical protein
VAPLPDDRYSLPFLWGGARFVPTSPWGTSWDRPHPSGDVVLRTVERKDRFARGIWETSTGRLVRFLKEAEDALWTPDGAHVVTIDASLIVTVSTWPGLAVEAERTLAFDAGAGVGGAELALSHDGRLASAWMFSGQSEEGFALFSIPGIETLASLPYVQGESATPCLFSPDDRWVALVREPDPIWWTLGDDRDWDTPTEGGRVHWATLHLQATAGDRRRLEHPILVDVPRGWFPPEELAGATWPRNVRFEGPARLGFDLPWGGSFVFEVPPEGPCVAPGPAPRT